jgi:UDP-glucose 4-epimerase
MFEDKKMRIPAGPPQNRQSILPMNRKVFITGVAGFLGSHLADAFLERGYAVSGIDNLIGGSLDNVPAGVEFRAVDCNELDSYADMLEGTDLVYHCAALAYEGLSVFSPHFIDRHISGASVGVLSNAIAKGVRRFVFCSSMARYGANAVPYREDQQPRPVDPYGVSKYTAEIMVRMLSDMHGMEFNIGVPHNIIGPRQRYDDPYRNVASIMINRMLQGQQPVVYGDGSQSRCFSFVGDVLPSLVLLGTEQGIRSETVNLGPDEEVVSILQLAQEIASQLDFDLKPIFVPARPLEVNTAFCCSKKARDLLGYRTSFTLREGLAAMIAWIRQNGTRTFRYNLPLEIVSKNTPATWTERLI